MISVSKMSDAGVHTIFERDTCNMVRGAMVFMRGSRIGTLDALVGFLLGCIHQGFWCSLFGPARSHPPSEMVKLHSREALYSFPLTQINALLLLRGVPYFRFSFSFL